MGQTLFVVIVCSLTAVRAGAQDAAAAPADAQPDRWNLFYQATSIGQYHGTFRSPYAGTYSLQDYRERVAESLYKGVARYAAGINGMKPKVRTTEQASR